MYLYNFYPEHQVGPKSPAYLSQTGVFALVDDADMDLAAKWSLEPLQELKAGGLGFIGKDHTGTHFFNKIHADQAPEDYPYIWGQNFEIPDWAVLYYRAIRISPPEGEFLKLKPIDANTFRKLAGPLRQEDKVKPHLLAFEDDDNA
jgi:hypothetical protein